MDCVCLDGGEGTRFTVAFHCEMPRNSQLDGGGGGEPGPLQSRPLPPDLVPIALRGLKITNTLPAAASQAGLTARPTEPGEQESISVSYVLGGTSHPPVNPRKFLSGQRRNGRKGVGLQQWERVTCRAPRRRAARGQENAPSWLRHRGGPLWTPLHPHYAEAACCGLPPEAGVSV